MPSDLKDYEKFARDFIRKNYQTTKKEMLLLSIGNTFYKWVGCKYKELDPKDLKAQMRQYFTSLPYLTVSRNFISEVLAAVDSIVRLEDPPAAPFLLEEDGSLNVNYLIPFSNGILNIKTWELLPQNPNLVNLSSIPSPYISDSEDPKILLGFLTSTWASDLEHIHSFQEWLGLLLTDITHFQKGLIITGPKRSGKGTIGKVILNALGLENLTSPTIAGFANQFGLASLINKKVALISDARFGGRNQDSQAIAENLLRIIGEDELSIPRKFRSNWEGKLTSRVVMFSNELPSFNDSSNALSSRFILLRMTKSFFGKEDPLLAEKLSKETTQIIAWAIKGLKRLIERGHLLQPSNALGLQKQLENMTSPIASFIEDMCVIGQDHETPIDAMFQAWKKWSNGENFRHAGTKSEFGKMLLANQPQITVNQRGSSANRFRVYSGVSLSDYNQHGQTRPTVTL